jgi:hypothetical protein
LRSRPNGAKPVEGGQGRRRASHERRPAAPVGDPEIVTSIEETKPGSALDDQLRREQAKAIFDLLLAQRQR